MRPLLPRVGGVTLIVAPHADDETIGAFGLVARLRRRGRRVRILVVADGAASHPASARWPAPRLVAERRRETRRVMRRAGVSAGAIEMLALPDGALPALSRRGIARITRAVRRVRGLALIVGPSCHDAHPDHRAVAAILARAGRGRRRLAYLVWSARRRPRGPGASLALVGGAAAKRSAIRGYRTQTGAITDDPRGFAIARHELDAFARPVERFVEERR